MKTESCRKEVDVVRFKEKLLKCQPGEIWEEYCGFLDLSIDEYMKIQYRLLDEQIDLFSKCGLLMLKN